MANPIGPVAAGSLAVPRPTTRRVRIGGYAFEVVCQSTYWLTLPPTYPSSILRGNGSVVHRSKSTVAFPFLSLMFDVMVWSIGEDVAS
jgi:hypothetical protein